MQLQEDKKSIVDGYEKIIKNIENLQKLEKEVQEINYKKQLFSKEIGQLTGELNSANEIPSQKNSFPHNHFKPNYIQNDFNPYKNNGRSV